jgi:hypothetical protein
VGVKVTLIVQLEIRTVSEGPIGLLQSLLALKSPDAEGCA